MITISKEPLIDYEINQKVFETEQQDFEERAESVFKVQEKYQIFFDNYYKMDEPILDTWLLNYIENEWDIKIVNLYIDYHLKNNPNEISGYNLMKLKKLKDCLNRNNLGGIKNYVRNVVNNSIEECNTLEFEIIWGEIETKTYKLWKNTSIANTNIVKAIIKKTLENKYRFTLKTEIPNKTYKFDIRYDNQWTMVIYDQFWTYIWRSNIEYSEVINLEWNSYKKETSLTPWSIIINTWKEKIKLDLIFKN